jgi:hypothetical protein
MTFIAGRGVCLTVDAKYEERVFTAAWGYDRPTLPRFALRLTMPRGYENMTYFGLGPRDNYSDKRLASYLGLFPPPQRTTLSITCVRRKTAHTAIAASPP